jgi:selenocysteine lyase/cysteine desulfurase
MVIRVSGAPPGGKPAIRVSTPIYISTKEIDMLLEGVNTLVRHKA